MTTTDGAHGDPRGRPVSEALAAVDATFDHVAHAVPSVADALPLYQGLLGGTLLQGGISQRGRHLAIQLTFPGGCVELLEPLPGSSPSVGAFLERNPRGGLHHLTFKVPDIHAALAALAAWGYHPIMTSLDSPTWKEAFLHPRETNGVLLQLAESHLPEPTGEVPVDDLVRRARETPPA